MDASFLALITDLHINQDRQGPGGEAETLRAIELAGLSPSDPLNIADIGCGTGASTRVLAKSLNAQITAVDLLPDFIDRLKENASTEGYAEKLTPLVGSMDALPFADDQFDVIWSEGAIYNMGFEAGLECWSRFLKPDGLLVVSELTWTTDKRPSELQSYWQDAYPEIGTASSKIRSLEQTGYSPIGYFTLPEPCWLAEYYLPLNQEVKRFLERHPDDETALSIAQDEEKEFAMYQTYKSYYSYGMYIARKNP